MNTERLQRILQKLKEKDLSQMIISDPLAIYYLTGRLIDPGERLLALYISQSGNNRIFINNLFTVPEDLGVEKVRFSDTDDSIALLAEALTPGEALGIDKIFPARFLLPLMERASASSYVLSSVCVDEVRACKDEEEKEKMRASSRVNDAAMARFREMVHEGVTEKDVAAHMLEIYQELGAEAYSFPPLVGFGPNAANGHHEPDDTVLKDGDCVLIDVGCKARRLLLRYDPYLLLPQGPRSETQRDLRDRAKGSGDCGIHAEARRTTLRCGCGCPQGYRRCRIRSELHTSPGPLHRSGGS